MRGGASLVATTPTIPYRYASPSKKDSLLVTVPVTLTVREVEILQFNVDGWQVKEISSALRISPSLTQKTINNLLLKTGTVSKAALAAWTVRKGLA
jgi:DNA-binding NarL/FixJ family response regulator